MTDPNVITADLQPQTSSNNVQTFVVDRNQQSYVNDCMTFKWSVAGSDICFDGWVGFGATILGLLIIGWAIALVAITSQTGRKAVSTAALVIK